MTNYRLINYLQDKKRYWKAKRNYGRLADRSAVRNNEFKAFVGEQKLQTRILWDSLKEMPYLLLAAIVFIGSAEVLADYLQLHFGLTLTVTTEGEDSLNQLLTALVTVLGVVLGLYFTTLSAVAGNLFIRAPASLQKLFLSDREGRQYVQTLVLALLIGIFYLLYISTGNKPSILGPSLLVIACAYVVMRFMALGSQSFYFIHPRKASEKLQGDMDTAINNVIFNKRGARRGTVQRTSRYYAAQALQTFDKLVDFGVDPVKLSGPQFATIATYIGRSVQRYLGVRNMIPTSSAWFTTKHIHKKWLISDDSSIMMALNTGTALQPESKRHMEWFEETALGIILKILRQLIEARDWSSAQRCLEVIVTLTENCGPLMSETTVTLLVDKTIEVVNEAIEKAAKNAEQDGQTLDVGGLLALYDGVGRLPIAAALGLIRCLHDTDAAKLVESMNRIKWNKQGDFYTRNNPIRTVTELEKIQEHFNNERRIEGRAISPDWYLRTLVLHDYLLAVNKYYEHIKSYDEVYKRHIERLTNEKKYVLAAAVASRGIEFSSKLTTLTEEVARIITGAEEFRMVKDLKWAEVNPDDEQHSVKRVYDNAIDRMTSLIVPLAFETPKEQLEGLPDFLGQSIVLGMQAVYEAVRDNDAKRLRKVFPPTAFGVLNAKEGIREAVKGWQLESQATLMSEPFEDILSLSGYIKIYAELYNNPELWRICQETWDIYLANTSDAKQLIEMLALVMKHRDSQFMIGPRASLRVNWDRGLWQKMRKFGIETGRHSSPFDEDDDKPVHKSALIRMTARNSVVMGADARTVFLSLYLSKHQAVQDADIDFPDRRDFERMYDIESQKYDNEDGGFNG